MYSIKYFYGFNKYTNSMVKIVNNSTKKMLIQNNILPIESDMNNEIIKGAPLLKSISVKNAPLK